MKVYLSILWSLLAFSLSAQLLVRVTSLPTSTPQDSKVHVAGNFNQWSPNDPNFVLQNNPDGTRTISLFPPVGKVEYKFTRGDWSKAEGDEHGKVIGNRTYNYDGTPSVVNVAILSWEDLDGKSGVTSTAASNVQILDHDFSMPQLDRKRRIWVYLPPDYHSSQKNYPVIYMHDGQNLFDNATAFAGEWQVDETLNQLFSEGDFGAIVIGIENGGWRRLDEYSPWYNEQLEAGGEGEKYVDFIANTLKPYIDGTFRTLPQREYTGIIGSSMGGLISHYAAVEHQEVFGKIGVLSPSFWFSNKVYNHATTSGKHASFKYYLSAGNEEGSEMVSGVNKMNVTLQQMGFGSGELRKTLIPNGTHTEAFWANEFASAYKWLFGDLTLTDVEDRKDMSSFRIRPNPAFSELWVDNMESVQGAEIQIVSIDGKFVRKYPFNGNMPIDIHTISEGTHVVSILIQNKVIFSEKLIVARS